MPNEGQIEAWNGSMGEKWAERQDRMDALLAPLSQVALERANVADGEIVLDIGCGCGATSIAMAAKSRSVTGYDISSPMLAAARERALGVDNVSFVEADASRVSLEPVGDLLFSRFGVMFFDDPVAAFANLRSGLRPGGRVCLLVWRSLMENEWMARPLGALMAFIESPAEPPNPRAPGPFAFADKDYVGELLAKAGFADIGFEEIDGKLELGSSAADAVREFGEMGPLASLLEQANERDKAVAAVQDVMAAHVGDDGAVRMGAACWIVSASVA